MRIHQLQTPRGRLITVVGEGGEVTHVAYGDLCQNLPASWRDSLPHRKRRHMFRRVFAKTTDLKNLTNTDRIDKQARTALEELLETLSEVMAAKASSDSKETPQ